MNHTRLMPMRELELIDIRTLCRKSLSVTWHVLVLNGIKKLRLIYVGTEGMSNPIISQSTE